MADSPRAADLPPKPPPYVAGPTHGEASPRDIALDALRGATILAMVVVAVEPKAFPAWMYHAQEPPPSHELNSDIPGLTWPDIVFPFFMFALGAAIPIALGKRLRQGATLRRTLLGVFERVLLLAFFAIAREHFDLWTGGGFTTLRAAIAPIAFVAFTLIFLRYPDRMSLGYRRALRGVGWVTIGALFLILPRDFVSFTDRVDRILMGLAYAALFGSVIWLVTRDNMLARVGIIGLVMAFQMSGWADGWIQKVWEFHPAGLLYTSPYLLGLCAVLPGTIVGDLLVRRRSSVEAERRAAWSRGRHGSVALLSFALIPIVLTGVQSRALALTTLVTVIVCGALGWVTRNPGAPTEVLLRQYVGLGAFLVLLGLMLDPFDEGMNKVNDSMAWMFASTGLAVFTLAVLTVIADMARGGRWLGLFVANGQNPMIAYVTFGMLIYPILALARLWGRIDSATDTFWPGVARTVVLTLAVALFVQQFTRRRLFWRT